VLEWKQEILTSADALTLYVFNVPVALSLSPNPNGTNGGFSSASIAGGGHLRAGRPVGADTGRGIFLYLDGRTGFFTVSTGTFLEIFFSETEKRKTTKII
jgi:hypothetical protein